MKVILFVHRYLAVGVGLLMVLWCLSGFVMMYQSFPELSDEQRVNGLAPLDFAQCCDLSALALDPSTPAPAFRIEMLRGDPVLRLGGGGRLAGTTPVTNLRTGKPLAELDEAAVLDVARQYGAGNRIAGTARSLGVIDIDQWTLQTARRNAPTYKVAFDDPAGTEIYVSGASGEVFQATSRRERVLSWFGAIPHWLYPTVLRQDGALWTTVVIWTAIAGSFLAATGMYVGISRLRRNKKGELASPYRGWWYWHHVSGLVFGVLALTWVFSGLMTMNPWGALSGGRNDPSYREAFTGTPAWRDVQQFLGAIQQVEARDLRQIQPAPFAGEMYFLARGADGSQQRLDAAARPAPLAAGQVEAVVAQLPDPVREFALLDKEDSYYYGHKSAVDLPVWRVLMDDADATRLYIDTDTGAMRAIGSSARTSRWIRTGLHDLDFPVLRSEPLWYVVVSVLLAGVTALCAIGTWLAIKRVRMDFRLYRARLRRRFGSGDGAVVQ
ncbi:MAG TPA: hypothetical protein VGE69_16065 [Pseudomonadales bacterium]